MDDDVTGADTNKTRHNRIERKRIRKMNDLYSELREELGMPERAPKRQILARALDVVRGDRQTLLPTAAASSSASSDPLPVYFQV